MTNEMEEIFINPLNLDNIPPFLTTDNVDGVGVYVIFGGSGSGKSAIIKNLAYSKKSIIPVAVVISETEKYNNIFSPIIPKLFIYDKLEVGDLKRFYERQEYAIKNLQNPWMTLIIDDCMNKKRNMKSNTEISLFKTSRHLKMMILIACQTIQDIDDTLKDQCVGFFITKTDNGNMRTKIYETISGIIPSKLIFDKLMDTFTRDYGCLYINMRSASDKWTDKVFYYKADLLDIKKYGNWSLVSSDVQDYHNDRYDPNHNM
jgi:hypothetical protein